MRSPARLVFPDGSDADLTGFCSIGRSRDNTIRLEDQLVGRRHAIIQCQNQGEFWLVDLGSCNGTSVNGRPVESPVALADGDLIEIAETRITFHCSAPALTRHDDTIGSRSTLQRGAIPRNCWLLVADIVDSTRRAREMPPEDLPRVNGEWFRLCREIIDDHDGHVNQYLGDGFLCYWNDSAETVGNVLATLQRLATLQANTSLPFRLAVHFGPVVLSKLPTLSVLQLHGPNVIFVFRMEKLAASLGTAILCSEPAWTALAVPALASHQAELKGYDEDFRFFVPDLDNQLTAKLED